MSAPDRPPSPTTERELERVAEVFHAARVLGPLERAAFLDARCAGDARLRVLVDDLLACDDQPHALDAHIGAHAATGLADTLPERVGRYRILRKIGAGGMGIVYEAEQESPRRVVALKVLRSVHATQEMLARFRREARVLGSLQHPAIAQVYEAGAAPLVVGGQELGEVPFLALELVRGERLTDAVARAGLALSARLELFARVCDALEHAHAQGIVHRDLKPGNILVVESGTTTVEHGAPTLAPKVLDFGIARLVDGHGGAGASGGDATQATRTGEVLGTLAYMSPEQARGATDAVDARTDVWALGVILFELLAGRRPFELDGLSLPLAARRLEDEEPTRLSAHDTKLRGDLEVIVSKALDKDPARRYASAGELAADVRRHLAHVPIRARPASATYLLVKYARRHRALVIAAASGLLALVGGLAYGLWREHDRRVESEAATQFLLDVLAAPSALTGKRNITLLEALERLEPQMQTRFADAPQLELRLRRAFGFAYNSLERRDRGRAMHRRALEIARASDGPRSREALALESELAHADVESETPEHGIQELERIVAEQTDVLGLEDLDTRQTRQHLADAYRSIGRLDAARTEYERLLATRSTGRGGSADGEQEDVHLWAHLGLAETLMELRELDASDAHFARALPALEAELGPDHVHVLGALHSLSILRSYQGRLDEAQELGERALRGAERAVGLDGHLTLVCLSNLATLEFQRGHFERARELLATNVERLTAAFGATHAEVLAARNNLAAACLRLRDHEAALAIFADVFELSRSANGPDSWFTWIYRAQQGQVLFLLGRHAEAETVLREAQAQLERVLGPDDERTRGTCGFLARALAGQGREAEAASWRARARPAQGAAGSAAVESSGPTSDTQSSGSSGGSASVAPGG